MINIILNDRAEVRLLR